MRIKRQMRNCLEKWMGKEIKYLSVDKGIKVVSFDVFDTLVVRNVLVPEDVFELVSIQYNRTHPKSDFGVNFHMLRVNAEKLAREKNGKKEVTLEEIYQCISGICDKSKKELMQIEIETECAICQPNYEIKDYFEHLVETGVTIVVTSDMYLSKGVIKSILEKCGYTKYTKLYVSSEYGDTKSAGTLFDRIIADFQIKSKELLHIGDNFKADYWIPRRKGIQSFLYRKKWYKTKYFRLLKKSMKELSREALLQFQMLDRIMTKQNMESTENEKIGYEILGPILLGYSMWLKKNVEYEKIDNIVFLSREGALLKKGFETLYPDFKGTHYINVSRLGMCRANAVNASSWQELQQLFSSVMRGVETVEDYLRLLGLTETDDVLLYQYHIDKSECLDEIENKEAIFEFIKSYGKLYFEKQNKLLKEYLRNNGFDRKNVAISDVGWSGTMQVLLAKIISGIKLEGYYLAVSDFQKDIAYCRCKRNGYFCNADEWEQNGKMIRFSQSALEILFLGNEGTTLEYKRENGKVLPLKAEQENKEGGIGSIEEVQNAAIHFLQDFRKESLDIFFEEIDKKIAFEPCFDFLIYPQKETVDFYKQMKFVDGMNLFSFIPKHNFIFYLLHPVELRKELEVNTSRIIWLKGLLKVPFPYFKFFQILADKAGIRSEYSKKYLKE